MSRITLASAVTLTGSAVASTYTASVGGLGYHALELRYTPGTDSTNALNVTIEVSNDEATLADSSSKWEVLGGWSNSSGTLTNTDYTISVASSGTSEQIETIEFPALCQKIRIKYLETNTPSPFGTITAVLTSSNRGGEGNIIPPAGTSAVDSAVFTDDAAFTPATSKVIAIGFQADETSADSVDEGDIGAPRMTLDRRVRIANKTMDGPGEPTIDSYTSAAVSASANTADQSLISAPGANKQIWVYGFAATSTLAGSMSLQDEDNTALSGVMPFGATGGIVIPPSGNFSMPWFKVATNKALEIDTVTGDAKGIISYAIVSV